MTSTKVCTQCKEEKNGGLFYPHKTTKDKLRPECKECTLKQNQKYADANSDKVKRNKRKAWFKHAYDVDVSLVDFLILKQEGKCLICRKKVPLELDHDHETGEVRGMLCAKCNKAIGLLEDSFENTLRAAEYLRSTAH